MRKRKRKKNSGVAVQPHLMAWPSSAELLEPPMLLVACSGSLCDLSGGPPFVGVCYSDRERCLVISRLASHWHGDIEGD